ncbi:succinic semialdehyde dehydrogenase [Allostreptomyces psammosilenae]|uniref:succinate-semialdehyde dehydrogenase (NADP(+)) n=1 Tax=Allostreptomyces psammosilenae TaxID=1892865 RepID=A0A852ZVK6_9ACTN|nr:succinic semialdehyde dehydrogenase [Allostreptomyces psammosilenae]NYI05975.1 succinate-semialdehyde dehydrogenase/glutarate-semialdehyde dehydrogenase [Allostreptomyces psammosilenae]
MANTERRVTGRRGAAEGDGYGGGAAEWAGAAHGNPVVPPGPRSPRDVVTPPVVRRLVSAVAASGDAPPITVVAPATGGVLARLPRSTEADVERAADAARAAQRAWARLPVRARCGVLLRFHDLVLRHREELLDLVQAETGKARHHAHEEVLAVAMAARHYAVTAPRRLRDRVRPGALPGLTAVREVRHPKGLVGLVSPWNYPLELAVSDALPAFAAGNAVLAKPDSQTALTALRGRELLVRAGLPADLWQVVLGDGPEVGPMVVDRADYVGFTGSTATGREVARRAAGRLVGAGLELGGKNAMLVLADADPDRAARGAVVACFGSAGQLCVSVERIYVHSSLREAFLERFAARVRAMRLGVGIGYGADMGTLTSARQLATVVRHVADAVAGGAEVVAGGRARPDVAPFAHEPTVLVGVRPQMAVHAEETFGPVVSVYSFDDEEEAVREANATPYGLNASVWTADPRRGAALARRLRAGTVNVNDGYAAAYGSVAAPMGGMGQSGLGRRHGAEGLLRYTETQTVAVQRVVPLSGPPGVPERVWDAALARGLRVLKALRLP